MKPQTADQAAQQAHQQLLHRMAQAVQNHCDLPEVVLIAEIMLTQAQRMAMLLSARAGERFTDAQFATFCLQCAKRLKAEAGAGPA